MSIVTASRPMRTTRPVTTSPCFGCFRLRSKRAPKSSSAAPISRSGCFVVSGIKALPPVGGISCGTRANVLPYSRRAEYSSVKTWRFARLTHPGPAARALRARRADHRRGSAARPSPPTLAHEALHAVHDLLERERGGVEDDGVGGRPERRVCARSVAPVALRELAGERRLVDRLRARA